MAIVSISASGKTITASVTASGGGTITRVNSWTWYKDGEVYATHSGGSTTDTVTITENGWYGVVCNYAWRTPYTYYTKVPTSIGSSSFEPSWTYVLYSNWDVDEDTGEIYHGTEYNVLIDSSAEGLYTYGGKEIDTVHSNYYEYTQWEAQRHTGYHTGTDSTWSDTIYVEIPPSAKKAYIYHNGNWVEATPYIYHAGNWVEAEPSIYDGGWQ